MSFSQPIQPKPVNAFSLGSSTFSSLEKNSFMRLNDNLLNVIFLFLETTSRCTLSSVNRRIAYLATSLHSQNEPMTWGQYQHLELLSKLFKKKVPFSQIHYFGAYKENFYPPSDKHLDYLRGHTLSKMSQLSTLSLVGCYGFSHQDFEDLGGLTKLRALDLSYCNDLHDFRLNYLSKLNGLHILNLFECSTHDTNLPYLPHFPSLTKLSLSHFTDQSLTQLTFLTALRLLDLSFAPITDAGLISLGHLTGLQVLNLSRRSSFDDSITGSGLEHLKNLSLLHTLDLSGCLISQNGASALGQLTVLRNLNIDYIDNQGAAYFTSLSMLRILNISYSLITDQGVRYLSGLRKLESLDLSHCPISGGALIHLSLLTALQTLSLSKSHLTDHPQINGAGLVHLAACTSLHTLYLSHCKLSYEGALRLGDLSSLEILDLHRSDFPEVCVVYLKKLQHLKILDLAGCKISNTDLDHINALTTLEHLNLSWPIPRNSLLIMYPGGLGAPMRYYRPTLNPITSAGLAKLTTLTSLRTLTLKGIKDAHLGDESFLKCIFLMPFLHILYDCKSTSFSRQELINIREKYRARCSKKKTNTRFWFWKS